jgi:hypothetical protein
MRFWGAFALAASLAPRAVIAQPPPETIRAFRQYSASVAARVKEDQSAGTLLRLASGSRLARLRAGQILTVSAGSLGLRPEIAIPHGQVQHWIGAAFVPHTTIARVLPGLQDYSNRKRYMKPVIVESRVLSRNGNDFQVYLRLVQQPLITAVFDVTLRIAYRPTDATHLIIESNSESVREVPSVDSPPGTPAHDRGFIWALDDYWRFAEQDGGVYVECEALVLSRQVPAVFRWIASGIIARVSERMLEGTLKSTARTMQDSAPETRLR